MVSTEFSEFSYGFAVVTELIGMLGNGVRAPTFPSLNEEGKLGFDVAVPDTAYGIPLFVQFKRPDWLVSSRAGEYDNFGGQYFRFPLRSGRFGGIDQHQLLLDLEGRFPGQVLYMAGRFGTAAELSRAFDLGSVIEESLVIRPSDVGQLDDELHKVAYSHDPTQDFLICSDPKRLRKPEDGLLLGGALRGERRSIRSIEDRLEQFLASKAGGKRPSLPHMTDQLSNTSPLDRLATELRYLANTELLIADFTLE